MKDIFDRMSNTVKHLETLHEIFSSEQNFGQEERIDYIVYEQNERMLHETLNKLKFSNQLYHREGRQMILADFLEYVFLGRGYYSMKAAQSTEDKGHFVRAVLHFVNLLMCYEALTVSQNLRTKFLQKLVEKNPVVRNEDYYIQLKDFAGSVGLKKGESDAPKHLDNYFDSMLPKTAGGLWHELLVYIFLLRNDMGHIIPLLLSQRLMSRTGYIIPPDFLIIAPDKNIYGIEVGKKKEIQSGSFSLQTTIPTATIDTENSRVSDRCPICKKWIGFCEFVICNYSNFDKEVRRAEVRCLEECNLFADKDIVLGRCPYTKYSRGRASTRPHARHKFANKLHYHYRCVLKKVPEDVRKSIIEARDTVALKTHYPYYSGLEELMKKRSLT